jgi:hypothetical protein
VKAVPRAEPFAKAHAQAQGRPYLVAKTPSAAPKREVENRRARQKEIEEERRRKKAAERAAQAVARAKAVEARTRSAWDRAKRELAAAELALQRSRDESA